MPLDNQIPLNNLSDSVRKIVTDVPHWLIRNGITFFFLLMLLLTIFASIISTPSVIKAKAVFESDISFERITVLSRSKLDKLLVDENTLVDSNDVLGFIQSAADHKDVLTLSSKIDTLINLFSYYNGMTFHLENFMHYKRLGELQGAYQKFAQDLINYESFLFHGLYGQKIKSINSEMDTINKENRQLQIQLNLQKNNLRLVKQAFELHKKLYKKSAITTQAYQAIESKLINCRISLRNTQAFITSNNSQLTHKQLELIDIGEQISERKSKFLLKINHFKTELDQWKKRYILRTNSKGTVVFNTKVCPGQWIEPNKPFISIEREKADDFFGSLQLDQHTLKKVKKGQLVMLKVEAYPYKKFGLLVGKLAYVPDNIAKNSMYNAKVTLSEGNKTTYNKQIKLKNGLQGHAEIITEKRSLLGKLFDNMYPIFKNRPN
jgi:HlyD family secretion protein